MKNSLYSLFIFTLCAVLLCACAPAKDAQSTPEAIATVSPTPTPAPEPTPDKSEYAQAYLAVIDQYVAEFAENEYVSLTYDLIDFGETKLLFVPLCGEKFTWEDKDGTV